MARKMTRTIHGEQVSGVEVDEATRCAHWHSELDIIAIKFGCCGRWFPCHDCHNEIAEHEPTVWPTAEFSEKAILCGGCGYQLTITEYFACDSNCPNCRRNFNPGCSNHYHLYFEARGN